MRKENEVRNLLKNIVINDNNIRLSVLDGSRTNDYIPQYDFQDYDISFFVTGMESYKKDDSCLGTFGDLIFIQKPEHMDLYSSELGNWFSYIMYFNDRIKIDITLIHLMKREYILSNSNRLVEKVI